MDQRRTKARICDLNKKYHLQVSERRFYSRSLLLDTQRDERVVLVDQPAERVQVLRVKIAMSHDIAETTIPGPHVKVMG